MMLWRAMGIMLCFLGPSLANSAALEMEPALRNALERVHQGYYEQAIATARELQADFPEHPIPSMITAEAYFGLIYCETGHITSREIWNVAERKTSSYDRKFFEAVEKSLERSQKMRQEPETAALGALYAGLARGARARLYTLRGEKMNAASEGKQMRADLLEAVAQDRNLASDADLGLGAYNYYADILSPLLKVIRFFLGIPGGDREEGLEQLQTAAEHASLVPVEAQYELARIYGLYEKRHAEALRMLQKLSEQYPQNALYLLSAAYQADLAGQKNVAVEYVRKAMEAAKTMDGVCRQRLGEVGQEALKRLPGTKER
ncbi:MAG: DUF3808 domain-containing protein [Acidobacteria bacterium]|nr:DUF3808 domain-containing protein [Acidobacteriota bacterium]